MMFFMSFSLFALAIAFLPAVFMLLALLPAHFAKRIHAMWQGFYALALLALAASIAALGLEYWSYFHELHPTHRLWFASTLFGAWVSVLVQFLGAVIIRFSARHLQGEPNQERYVQALALVLTSVHLLLLANHWWVLIAAWAAIGLAMHRLLVFYPERSFAQLAAHKKRVADRAADVLLLAAAACAWQACGSGYLTDLWQQAAQGASLWLNACALLLATAVILRTALLPVHGWLIQVMEAPTPVSALLHAGVVNLGGFVLVLFAPLLAVSEAARWLLVVVGAASAVLAGTVMLTRVSIKVHLAWSTLAQMGFMLLECGLGLYSLAALHLLGHSLYKAHSFLSASSQVKRTTQALLSGHVSLQPLSFFIAPLVAATVVFTCHAFLAEKPWPWWWQAVLALAWAPLLWLPKAARIAHWATALLMVCGFSVAAFNVELLPLNLTLQPFEQGGWLAFASLLFMYIGFVGVLCLPKQHSALRHWIYAGFYLDEIYTRVALFLWPAQWVKTRPLALNKTPSKASAALSEVQHA